MTQICTAIHFHLFLFIPQFQKFPFFQLNLKFNLKLNVYLTKSMLAYGTARRARDRRFTKPIAFWAKLMVSGEMSTAYVRGFVHNFTNFTTDFFHFFPPPHLENEIEASVLRGTTGVNFFMIVLKKLSRNKCQRKPHLIQIP